MYVHFTCPRPSVGTGLASFRGRSLHRDMHFGAHPWVRRHLIFARVRGSHRDRTARSDIPKSRTFSRHRPHYVPCGNIRQVIPIRA